MLLTVSYSLFPKVRDPIDQVKLNLTAALAATGTAFHKAHKSVFVELKQLFGDGLLLFVEEVTRLAFTHIPYMYSY